MALKHVSDTDLQDYLDGSLSSARMNELEKHLADCPSCQEQFNTYKSLYTELGIDIPFELTPKFSKKVVEKIQKESMGSVHGQLWHIFMILFALIVCINVSIYYFDFKPLLQNMQNIFQPKADLSVLEDALTQTHTFLDGLQVNTGLLLGAVVVFLILSFIDHYFLRLKKKLVSSS